LDSGEQFLVVGAVASGGLPTQLEHQKADDDGDAEAVLAQEASHPDSLPAAMFDKTMISGVHAGAHSAQEEHGGIIPRGSILGEGGHERVAH
jgi:hypothetical protein